MISTFALNQLQEANLGTLAYKLRNQNPLDQKDLFQLANIKSLAFLSTLASIITQDSNSKGPHLRFIYFLPLAALLEKFGKENVINHCCKRLLKIDLKFNSNQPICLAIDRWKGKFKINDLLFILNQITSNNAFRNNFIPLGPSTSELKNIMQNYEVSIENLLETFFQHEIKSIEGGSDLEIHQKALAKAFSITISHPILLNNQQDFSNQLINDLYNINNLLGSNPKFLTWFPWSPSLTKDPQLILKSIALGRILLPKTQYIRSSLSILGPILPQVTLHFGANDLGFAAIDNSTANSLGLVKLSETQLFDNYQKYFSMVV